MQRITKALERLHSITGITLTLTDGNGSLLGTWPFLGRKVFPEEPCAAALMDCCLQKRDALHPLVSFLEPGFLLGVAELEPDRYVLIGLVSPYVHSRAEVLKMAGNVIQPEHLQQYCDLLLNQPLVTLEKMKDLICLLGHTLGLDVPEENILFVDNVSNKKLGVSVLDQSLFEQREEPEAHVPVDFETAICAAVESGNRTLLERSLLAPRTGRVGRMSQNNLRQEKYSFICLATLVSRAAIRGGLPVETAFNLSDLYCQRADLLTEIPLIQNLVFTMLNDFCGKVREIRKQAAVSPLIRKCLTYISVHLHEPIGLEQLSRHCNLCARSISLRFNEEMGMSIPEYINREKLLEAKYLLEHSGYSISDISTFLNYPSQSYFAHVFKKYNGLTPQKYRNGKE